LVKNKATNKWVFPSTPIEEKVTFKEMKKEFFKKLSLSKWNVKIYSNIFEGGV
jgi:hypothetical protein